MRLWQRHLNGHAHVVAAARRRVERRMLSSEQRAPARFVTEDEAVFRMLGADGTG